MFQKMTTCLFIRDEVNIHLVADGLAVYSNDFISSQESQKIIKISNDIFILRSGSRGDATYLHHALIKLINDNEPANLLLDLKNISKDLNSEIILYIYDNAYIISNNYVDIITNNFHAIGAGYDEAGVLWAYLKKYEPKLPFLEKIKRIYDVISSNYTHTNYNYTIKTICTYGVTAESLKSEPTIIQG